MKLKFESSNPIISKQILIAIEIFKIMNEDDINLNVNVKYHQGKNAENGILYVDDFKISHSCGYDIYITGEQINKDEYKLFAEFEHNQNIEIKKQTAKIIQDIKTILIKNNCEY